MYAVIEGWILPTLPDHSNQEVASASIRYFSALSNKGRLGRNPPSEIKFPVIITDSSIGSGLPLIERNWVNSRRGAQREGSALSTSSSRATTPFLPSIIGS